MAELIIHADPTHNLLLDTEDAHDESGVTAAAVEAAEAAEDEVVAIEIEARDEKDEVAASDICRVVVARWRPDEMVGGGSEENAIMYPILW